MANTPIRLKGMGGSRNGKGRTAGTQEYKDSSKRARRVEDVNEVVAQMEDDALTRLLWDIEKADLEYSEDDGEASKDDLKRFIEGI